MSDNKFRLLSDMSLHFGEGQEAGVANFSKGAEIDFYVTEGQDLAVEMTNNAGEPVELLITDGTLAGQFLDNVVSEDEELTESEQMEVSIPQMVLEGIDIDDIAKAMVAEKMVKTVKGGEVVTKNVNVRRRKRKLSPKQKAALAAARKKSHSASAKQSLVRSLKVRKRLGLENFDSEATLIESIRIEDKDPKDPPAKKPEDQGTGE